ncbi:HD domain-containing protein [Clostridium sediminicola]|uniref:HD domain-containing protein n=1 Tax=Clostridium sediminicola TaxID=3114879 RepID=UPI0031F22F81
MEKKKLFNEFTEHLLKDEKPSNYFQEIFKDKSISEMYPYKLLSVLKEVPQNLKYHPEGSVWNHTMLVVDMAADMKKKSMDQKTFMWAALLHDLGKHPTTKLKKGRIVSYDHDRYGRKLAIKFLQELTEDEEFIIRVASLVRWHMNALFVVKDLPFANLENLTKEVSIDEIALLTICDRLGRGGMTEEKVREEKNNIDLFVKKCKEFKEI